MASKLQQIKSDESYRLKEFSECHKKRAELIKKLKAKDTSKFVAGNYHKLISGLEYIMALCIRCQAEFGELSTDMKEFKPSSTGHHLGSLYEAALQSQNVESLKKIEDILPDEMRKIVQKIFVLNEKKTTKEKESRFNPRGDYTIFKYKGQSFEFTRKQAQAIKFMYEKQAKGKYSISKDEILEAANSSSKDLRDLFKSGGKKHPAWGTLIQRTEYSYYRLDISPSFAP